VGLQQLRHPVQPGDVDDHRPRRLSPAGAAQDRPAAVAAVHLHRGAGGQPDVLTVLARTASAGSWPGRARRAAAEAAPTGPGRARVGAASAASSTVLPRATAVRPASPPAGSFRPPPRPRPPAAP